MLECRIIVDPRVYRLSAVKAAAYRISDRAFVRIELAADGEINVRLTPKADGESLAALEGLFRNEILDQDLRERIAEETAPVRNLLLAQAFSGVGLTDRDADTADYRQDPLGIGRAPNDKT